MASLGTTKAASEDEEITAKDIPILVDVCAVPPGFDDDMEEARRTRIPGVYVFADGTPHYEYAEIVRPIVSLIGFGVLAYSAWKGYKWYKALPAAEITEIGHAAISETSSVLSTTTSH